MVSIDSLLTALDEMTIAREVEAPHDEARSRYFLRSNTVRDDHEFVRIITDYYTKHYAACVSGGAILPDYMAFAKAEKLLEQEYRRRGGSIATAFSDARDGLNGGMRTILNMIAEGLKAEAVESYVRYVFHCQVGQGSWENKVEIIRQFMDRCGDHLPSSIRTEDPERYANNYEELIRGYIAAMRKTSSIFRHL